MTELQNFKRFLKQREEASRAYVNGDIGPLDRVSTHTSPATFFSPGGDRIRGAAKVNAANARGARSFAPGGRTTFKILHLAAAGGVAFLAGIQQAVVRLPGKP